MPIQLFQHHLRNVFHTDGRTGVVKWWVMMWPDNPRNGQCWPGLMFSAFQIGKPTRESLDMIADVGVAVLELALLGIGLELDNERINILRRESMQCWPLRIALLKKGQEASNAAHAAVN